MNLRSLGHKPGMGVRLPGIEYNDITDTDAVGRHDGNFRGNIFFLYE